MTPTARGNDAAWAAAILVVTVSLLSTYTLSHDNGDSTRGSNAASTGNAGNGDTGGTITMLPDGSAGSTGGTSSPSGPVALPSQLAGGTVTGAKTGTSASGQQTVTYTVAKGGHTYQYTKPVTSTGSSGGGSSSGGTTLAAGGGGSGGGGGGGTVSTTGDTGTNGTTGDTGGGPNPSSSPTVSADCAKGQNAGASDWGVKSNEIDFAATVVAGGVAKDFLYPAVYGMNAIKDKVNRAGGICGRLLKITEQNDDWDASTGAQDIQQFITCKCNFGLAVNPSSEGLRGAIDAGYLDQNSFPAIGTDGMLKDQYTDPWVWPVATSTNSVMHIVADYAKSLGAKTVGLVYDKDYHFGVEGANAFANEAKRDGMSVTVSYPVDGDPSHNQNWGTAASDFIGKCGSDFGSCDFVAAVIEPTPGLNFVKAGGFGDGKNHPKYGYGVPQPLFYTPFAQQCQAACNGMVAFTSFNPPVQPYANSSVGTYVSDMRAQPSTDIANPEVEGAYQGMQLLVQALTKLGAAPTRSAMKDALDSTTLDTGLSPALTFKSGDHFAAVFAQGMRAIYNGNTFTGWQYKTGFLTDKNAHQDL